MFSLCLCEFSPALASSPSQKSWNELYKVGRSLSKKRHFRTHKDFYLLRVFLSDAWLMVGTKKASLQSFQTSSSNSKQGQESSRSRYLRCAQLVFHVLGGFRNLASSHPSLYLLRHVASSCLPLLISVHFHRLVFYCSGPQHPGHGPVPVRVSFGTGHTERIGSVLVIVWVWTRFYFEKWSDSLRSVRLGHVTHWRQY